MSPNGNNNNNNNTSTNDAQTTQKSASGWQTLISFGPSQLTAIDSPN